jgi:hypothetical protein
MAFTPDTVHPLGEADRVDNSSLSKAIEVETFAAKVLVEWDPTAAVTPIGQLPFFIEILKLGHRFNPRVEDCPLHYTSNNAPKKIDMLGSLFLSILSGHNRYTHLTALRGDSVNTQPLGMNKVVSDDSCPQTDGTSPCYQLVTKPPSILLRTPINDAVDTGCCLHGCR